MLSRLIVEIANHPLLGEELVFRGGTCLHKVWLDRPWRYSEDLDYVRRTGGGVGEILDSIRDVAVAVGFDRVQTDVRRYPKVRLDTSFMRGGRMRVKVELNTFERSPARPTVTRTLDVDSPWFSGTADVPTFALEELVATKMRALFQPRWLVPNGCLVCWCRAAAVLVRGRVGRCGVEGCAGACRVGVGRGSGASGLSRGPICQVLSAARARRGARCWRLRPAG